MHIVEDQCSFSHNEPVPIKLEDSGTYSIPGWILSQERSTQHSIVWINQANRTDYVTWTRPNNFHTSAGKADFESQVTYGPFMNPPHETL